MRGSSLISSGKLHACRIHRFLAFDERANNSCRSLPVWVFDESRGMGALSQISFLLCAFHRIHARNVEKHGYKLR